MICIINFGAQNFAKTDKNTLGLRMFLGYVKQDLSLIHGKCVGAGLSFRSCMGNLRPANKFSRAVGLCNISIFIYFI